MKMEAIYSSETSGSLLTTRGYNPEYCAFRSNRREKSNPNGKLTVFSIMMHWSFYSGVAQELSTSALTFHWVIEDVVGGMFPQRILRFTTELGTRVSLSVLYEYYTTTCGN
jgi:hypothetical protein